MGRDELAAAAGMAPDYLRYLEEHPAEVSPAAVVHLARALGTTAADLLGAHAASPPAPAPPAKERFLVALSEDECHRLLAEGGIGRVVLVEPRGPAAMPVNFGVLDGDIVYRTGEESPAATVDGDEVGFEVDHVDQTAHEAWSVLVTGTAHRLADPVQIDAVHKLVEPWAGGRRDVTIRLTPSEVSGRRIRADR